MTIISDDDLEAGYPAVASDAPTMAIHATAAQQPDLFDIWREMMSPIFAAELDRDGSRLDFALDFRAVHLGSFALAETRTVSQTFRRDGATIARGGVDNLVILHTRWGGSTLRTEGREVTLDSGDMWICDLSRPISVRAENYWNIALMAPRSRLEPLVEDPDALHGTKISSRTSEGGALADHLRGLSKLIGTSSAREMGTVAAATLPLVARCFGPTENTAAPACEAVSEALLERLKRGIEAHLADPDLGPELIMRRSGLSRARLYRLFENEGGVADYIRRRRLRACLLDLQAGRKSPQRLADIALEWGFSSEAAFQRAFRAQFGISPSEVRQNARGETAFDGRDAMDWRMASWLRDIMCA